MTEVCVSERSDLPEAMQTEGVWPGMESSLLLRSPKHPSHPVPPQEEITSVYFL